MNREQRDAARESMIAWLSHPDELGAPPAKTECAGEFALHGLRYYIFKYKKSVISLEWLLGVCGGYAGDELEHCGHVFSEMEPYDEVTAEERAASMAGMIRECWMREAGQAETADAGDDGGFVSFVLLGSAAWNAERFRADLEREWGLDVPLEEAERGGGGRDTLVWDVDGMLATVSLMPGPVPDGEAERNAASNYMWSEAVSVTAKHRAHLLAAVLRRGNARTAAGELLVKLCDACLLQRDALGVYTAGTVFAPGFYRDAASVMRAGEPPVLNLVHFGLVPAKDGVHGYTCGLSSFGKDEVEVIASTADPADVRDLLFNVAAYVISTDATLRDGETLGCTADQKLPIVRSGGVNLTGETLKIRFHPAG
jgi:hypothetical protein